MIVYKIDKQPHLSANGRIRDMAPVLNEIATSLQILQDVMTKQGQAISSPSIDSFRHQLNQDVVEAIVLTRNIAEQSQKLAGVSEQAAKHLVAIEDHFSAVLRSKSAQTADIV